MEATQLFEAHNKSLLEKLIPQDHEPVETYFTVDPNDEIFHQPIPQNHEKTVKKN